MTRLAASSRRSSATILIVALGLLHATAVVAPTCLAQQDAASPQAALLIQRLIPPEGQAPPPDVSARLRTRLQGLQGRAAMLAPFGRVQGRRSSESAGGRRNPVEGRQLGVGAQRVLRERRR